jgi:hypothetical protein
LSELIQLPLPVLGNCALANIRTWHFHVGFESSQRAARPAGRFLILISLRTQSCDPLFQECGPAREWASLGLWWMTLRGRFLAGTLGRGPFLSGHQVYLPFQRRLLSLPGAEEIYGCIENIPRRAERDRLEHKAVELVEHLGYQHRRPSDGKLLKPESSRK